MKVELAKKANIPVVATAHTRVALVERGLEPAAIMMAVDIGQRLIDPEWQGLDGQGPYDLVLVAGLPYYMGWVFMASLKDFAPHLATFVREAKSGGKDLSAMGEALVNMHTFLQEYEFKATFKARAAWEAFKQEISEDVVYSRLKVSALINIARIIQHVLRLLAYRYPEVNICHSSSNISSGGIDSVRERFSL